MSGTAETDVEGIVKNGVLRAMEVMSEGSVTDIDPSPDQAVIESWIRLGNLHWRNRVSKKRKPNIEITSRRRRDRWKKTDA